MFENDCNDYANLFYGIKNGWSFFDKGEVALVISTLSDLRRESISLEHLNEIIEKYILEDCSYFKFYYKNKNNLDFGYGISKIENLLNTINKNQNHRVFELEVLEIVKERRYLNKI